MRNSISGLNHPAFGVRRSALALSLAMLISAGAVGAQTAAAPAQAFNTSQYSAIAAKAAQAQGAPVVVQTNLFLGWPGAWDTVVMKQGNILEKWLPKGSTVEWKRNLQGPPVITDLLAN
ncbi:MAG: hypothetical protein Q7U14_11370, partial [Lacisediminimonas sp.]|nr:hypothetical protein [Lacisediminimonas sp.]